MPGETWIVVGLGNPGERYRRTRHNVGFRLVDRLAEDLSAGPEEAEAGVRVRWAEMGERRVALLKPLTYMNRSGEALRRFPASVEAGPGRHLVVLDDVALRFGSVRFRPRGSSGGHRGLASVLEALESEEVPRLRMGVGSAKPGTDLADHVLEPFSADEEAALPPWLARASEGVRTYLELGPEEAMSRFNRSLAPNEDKETR